LGQRSAKAADVTGPRGADHIGKNITVQRIKEVLTLFP
jgi:hypothetical protein